MTDEHEVIRLERVLLDPVVRADAERTRALLHPDFVEFGASGRQWDRSSISAVTSGIEEPISAAEFRAARLGPDAILLTYRSDASGRRALRSSIWVRVAAGEWLLRFHQGTVTD